MPAAKVGKVYPLSYFSNFDKCFKPSNGIFTYKGWRFERVARNKVKVLEIKENQT